MDELIFAFLATRAEHAKAHTCRKKLVGPMRRYLKRYDGAAVQTHPALPPHAAALIADRTLAARDLAQFCHRCGRCDDAKIFG